MMVLLPLAFLHSGCGSDEGRGSSGEAARSVPRKALTQSLEAHQNTLTYNVINLGTWANRLRKMIEAENRKGAVASYLHVRAWLGRIEPTLAALPAVSRPLLSSDGDEGFPRIEQALQRGNLQQLQPLMKGFHRHMEDLRLEVEHAGLEPAQVPKLALGSLRSLSLANSTDLPNLAVIKAAANLEGVRALFLAILPALEEYPALRKEMKRSLAGIFRTLGGMEGPGGDSRRSELGSPAILFQDFELRPERWEDSLRGRVAELAGLFAETARLRSDDE